MARRKAIGALSSSCPCWGADHPSLGHCGSGDGGIGDGREVFVGIVVRSEWRWGISCPLHLDR